MSKIAAYVLFALSFFGPAHATAAQAHNLHRVHAQAETPSRDAWFRTAVEHILSGEDDSLRPMSVPEHGH